MVKLSYEEFSVLPDLEKHAYISLLPGAKKRQHLVRGVGSSDVEYPVYTRIDGVRVGCPAYLCWVGMLARSYSKTYINKYPTYADVSVCTEWFSMSTFVSWWVENQVDGWHLDKDLLSGSKTYSPETCIFVPPWLNLFTISRLASRGNLPIGVCKMGHKFQAALNDGKGGRLHLGMFDTAVQAHDAWKKKKLELALSRKGEMDAIDGRIYPRVVIIIERSE